jgi:hypothetical protein
MLCALVGGLLAFVPELIYYGNFGLVLLELVTIPLITLIVLTIAAINLRRQTSSALAMIGIYGIMALAAYMVGYNVHVVGRWLLLSNKYKPLVLSQPENQDGELKHIVWDGWGMAGQDTDAYLVFDPSDSLRHKKAYVSTEAGAQTCDIWKIQRLEKQWYNVVFYTNTGWETCFWK